MLNCGVSKEHVFNILIKGPSETTVVFWVIMRILPIGVRKSQNKQGHEGGTLLVAGGVILRDFNTIRSLDIVSRNILNYSDMKFFEFVILFFSTKIANNIFCQAQMISRNLVPRFRYVLQLC